MPQYQDYSNVTGLRSGDMFLLARPDLGDTVNIYGKDVATHLLSYATGRNANVSDSLNNDDWLSWRSSLNQTYYNVNKNAWRSFTTKLLTGTGEITMIRAGAGLVFYLSPYMIDKPFNKVREAYGKRNYDQFPDIAGWPRGAVQTVTNRAAWFPGHTMITGAGATIDLYPYFGYTNVAPRIPPVNVMDVYYLAGTGGGGFSLYTGVYNDSAYAGGTYTGTWNFVTGINAFNASPTCRRASITGANPGDAIFRLSGTGTCSDLRIISMNTNSTQATGRLVWRRYENNGSVIQDISADSGYRDQIRGTIFSGWNPDIMLFSFIGTNDVPNYSSFGTTGLNSFFNFLKTNFPNMPVVVASTYPLSDNVTRENLDQRRLCIKYGYSFWDATGAFRSTGDWFNRGFGIPGDVHHTASGAYAYSYLLDSWFNVLET